MNSLLATRPEQFHCRHVSKDVKTKDVLWLSLVVGQITSHRLVTRSGNLVTSAKFLVALATSESCYGLPSESWSRRRIQILYYHFGGGVLSWRYFDLQSHGWTALNAWTKLFIIINLIYAEDIEYV